MAAGRVGGIVENSTRGFDMMSDNLRIQQNLFQACIEFDVRKSVFFGSSCMYPRICPQPMKEEYLLSGKPEETSLPYAISKLSGLHLGLAYNKQSGKTVFLPVIPNSAYGPFDDFNPKTSHVLSALLSRFHEAKKRDRMRLFYGEQEVLAGNLSLRTILHRRFCFFWKRICPSTFLLISGQGWTILFVNWRKRSGISQDFMGA